MSDRFQRRFEVLDRLSRNYKGQSSSKGDYLTSELDKLLYKLIGEPGSSSGKNSIKTGDSVMGYTSGQVDPGYTGVSTGQMVGTGLLGMIPDLVGLVHSDIAAKVAYKRQNEFYDNHISMPAKVEEYKEAGLNPMGLTGSGPGATSAPSVDSAATPGMSGIGDLLGTILNYKVAQRQLDLEDRKIGIEGRNVASEIEYRAEQRIYQSKVNEWFDANQVYSLNKMEAETKDALQRVNTGEADELLKLAGVSKTEAESALIFQQELEKLWQNSPEWRETEIRLKKAQSSSYSANAAHTIEDINNLVETRKNIVEDTALKVANSALGRQQLKNLGLTEQQIQFAIDHQRGDLIWSRVGQIGSALKDVGIGVGSAAAGLKGISFGQPREKVGFPDNTGSSGRITLNPENPYSGLRK